jgi:hypothetical protein
VVELVPEALSWKSKLTTKIQNEAGADALLTVEPRGLVEKWCQGSLAKTMERQTRARISKDNIPSDDTNNLNSNQRHGK